MIRLAESQYLRQMGARDLYRFTRTLWHWSTLTERPGYFPEFLWIETTNACNLRCKMCPQSLGGGRATGRMTDELYQNLLRQAEGRCYGIFLFFGGDPLCDANFEDKVAEARERGIRVFVHTNAALLTPERAERLLAAGPSTVSFSLDTADSIRYEEYRVGAIFNDTLSNVKQFIACAKGVAKPPLTIVQLIDIDGSGPQDEIALRHCFGEHQPDSFRIRPLHDWAGELGPELGYRADHRHPYYPCVLLWKAMVVCWDGSVAACCNDLDGHYLLGNVNDESLMEVWQGARMVGLRRALIENRVLPALCHDCTNLHHPIGSTRSLQAVRWILGGSRKVGS